MDTGVQLDRGSNNNKNTSRILKCHTISINMYYVSLKNKKKIQIRESYGSDIFSLIMELVHIFKKLQQ